MKEPDDYAEELGYIPTCEANDFDFCKYCGRDMIASAVPETLRAPVRTPVAGRPVRYAEHDERCSRCGYKLSRCACPGGPRWRSGYG